MEQAVGPRLEAEQAQGTGSKTIADLLPNAVAQFGPRAAVMFKDERGNWETRTYSEIADTIRQLSLGLVELGVEKGEVVSILANTRPEWTYFDFAALTAGAVVAPIYQTNSAEECRYVLEDSDAKVVVVEDEEQMEKIRAVRNDCPQLEHVVRMTGSSDDAISMQDLAARGSELDESDWEQRWRSVTPEDVCTFIYTSGTTGPPKGCVITHGNYRSMLDMINSVHVIEEEELTYLFLPLAHSFAVLVQFGSFDLGATLAYWERDPLKIAANLVEVRPTYFPSVPRIFEKIYAGATAKAESAGGFTKLLFDWAIRVGRQVRELERQGREPGPLLRWQYMLADRQVLSKIRGLFGGRLRLAVSGAAPINPEILHFFEAAGVLVLEGWGMTETSTAATISTPDDYKIGTIGKPFPGCEVRIAPDGEILVKGPNVFQGYYRKPEATSEALVDGWLHTGDIGEIDEDGYIKITGRKKDIIITAGGKNITPANLEAEIKQHPLVSQCVVVGDRRPYLVALVTLDEDEARSYAKDHGLPEDPEALASSEKVKAEIEAHVEQINKKFARVEQVKKIRILPQDLSQARGELTPTLKVKRAAVVSGYEREIEELYES
jgi:long-chain acyl-CoA synthetase